MEAVSVKNNRKMVNPFFLLFIYEWSENGNLFIAAQSIASAIYFLYFLQ